MAHNETTATAHHATHLIIYAPRGTAEPRRDCPTIGYRNDISKHAAGKGKTYTQMADAAKGQQKAEEQIAQCRQELTEARLLSLGYVPVEQEDGTILYINEQTKYLAYEE